MLPRTGRACQLRGPTGHFGKQELQENKSTVHSDAKTQADLRTQLCLPSTLVPDSESTPKVAAVPWCLLKLSKEVTGPWAALGEQG